jgi:uracil phosphoribosyltransferase
VSTVTVVDHPLVAHKLGLLRDRRTTTAQFRQLTREIALLLGYEATRHLPLEPATIDTPLEPAEISRLTGKKPCFVSILRAGDGLLAGMLDLVPSACVGQIGLARDHITLRPVEYCRKLPDDLDQRTVIVLDPALATGHSAVAALDAVQAAGASDTRLVCLVAAPEGLKIVAASHPDTLIITAAIDRGLDARGYIRPGFGDAGDRLCGTG